MKHLDLDWIKRGFLVFWIVAVIAIAVVRPAGRVRLPPWTATIFVVLWATVGLVIAATCIFSPDTARTIMNSLGGCRFGDDDRPERSDWQMRMIGVGMFALVAFGVTKFLGVW